jgi:hypothetical protein
MLEARSVANNPSQLEMRQQASHQSKIFIGPLAHSLLESLTNLIKKNLTLQQLNLHNPP